MRIIINADDLGFNHEANTAILSCIEDGVITSSSIMANGAGYQEVKDIVRAHPEISFGVHLCLDEVKPLLMNDFYCRNNLLDERGVLKTKWYEGLKFTEEIKSIVFQEWSAQIKKILDDGLSISHIDSHHHCHSLPALKEVLLNLARKNNISRARLNQYIPIDKRLKLRNVVGPACENEVVSKGSKFERIIRYIKTYYEKTKENDWLKNNFTTTDFFVSTGIFVNNMKLFDAYGTIELMCHPGHPLYKNESLLLYDKTLQAIDKINYYSL